MRYEHVPRARLCHKIALESSGSAMGCHWCVYSHTRHRFTRCLIQLTTECRTFALVARVLVVYNGAGLVENTIFRFCVAWHLVAHVLQVLFVPYVLALIVQGHAVFLYQVSRCRLFVQRNVLNI
jgi:hypothetical protein